MGGGPIVMAIIYWFLGRSGVVESLSVHEVVLGIISSSLLALIAAGSTVVYTNQRLHPAVAGGIHALVLYLDYILIYLLNGWLKQQLIPILVFTVIFVVGYAIIWLCIWLCIRRQINSVNAGLKNK